MHFKQISSGLFLLFVYKIFKIYRSENNTCTTYYDYYFIDSSPNCYNNPDVGRNTPEVLSRLVGTYDNHTVVTEDGFQLLIFRIPHKDPSGIAILLHPVTIDAVVWVGQDNTSLGYLLWERGYDVWMPNQRGTHFSSQHSNYTTKDSEFWDHSFEEIGLHDYSACIKYISNVTSRNDLIVIGHSMATTASLIYASLKPEEAREHVKIFIQLSPTTSLKYMTSGLKDAQGFVLKIAEILKQFGIYHAFKYDSLWRMFFYLLSCIPFKRVVAEHINRLMGSSMDEFDPRWLTVLFSQVPEAFSTKTLTHLTQLQKGGFCRFDYGPDGNLKRYNSSTPPEYPVWKIASPVYLITSLKDSISTIKDNEILYNKLSPNAKVYGRNITDGVNHIEFHFGKNKMKYVYEPIFEILKKIATISS